MKKTIFLVLTVLVVLVGGFFALDAYLCSHLYYGWSSFSTCSGGQGAGLNMLGTGKNRALVVIALAVSLLPLGYMFFAHRKIHLRTLFFTFITGVAVYMISASAVAKSLLGSAWLIQGVHVFIVFALLVFFLAAITALGDILFKAFRWQQDNTIHSVFVRFAVGLIAFCVGNVLLLMAQVYFGITVRLQVFAGIFLIWKQKKFLQETYNIIEHFVQSIYNAFTSKPWLSVVFYLLVAVICVYICMGFNLAFIPYSTAWDANHAYLFFPRAWSLHNGLYWGISGAGSIPYLWYGFLTFWFKLASSFFGAQSMFGISPDGLAVIMNFWSAGLVLLAFIFLIDAFVKFLQDKHGEKKENISPFNNEYTMAILCIGLLLMILWLSSGMGAFLVFVDNKTDLAVMFFAVLALYAGLQFIRQINGYIDQEYTISSDKKEQSGSLVYSKKNILHFAILSGILFAASAVAKPTGMFDIVHFGVLLLLQRQVLLFGFGVYTLILGALGLTQMMLIGQFLTVSQSWVLVGIGFAISIIAVVLSMKKKGWKIYMRYLLIWAATTIAGIILYKGPFVIINNMISGNHDIPGAVRTIILGKNTLQDYTSTPVLLASNVSLETLGAVDTKQLSLTGNAKTGNTLMQDTATMQQCTSISTDKKTLYSGLKEIIGSVADEDLGRYIGYGWKTISNNMFTFLLPKGCYSFYKDAQYLCKNNDILTKTTFVGLVDLLSKAPDTDRIQGWRKQAISVSGDVLGQEGLIMTVKTYVYGNSIQKISIDGQTQVNIPYKYLIPFNVTFNWSLQNLSSYYTDIGIIWLLGLGIVILGLLYGLIARKRQLAVISIVTLGAWGTWRIVGSGIIWYSLGLIVWTILGMIAYFYYMYRSLDKQTSYIDRICLYILAGSFVFFALVQLILNFVRISSQGGNGPFVWYKGNVGEKYLIDKDLAGAKKQVLGYGAKDVFDLQFPNYNPILSVLNTREKDHGVVIAGTYMQYFINDQKNVSSDGFLTEFWKNASDNNVCNTYKRLVDKKLKYLVIDPNIASVVMGGGNSTLMDRFFAVLGQDGSLLQHGTLTMLQALVQKGYLTLFSTNSLVTKYSFVASDSELSQLLNVPSGNALLLERARMSAAKYFPKMQEYANAAAEMLSKRIQTFEGLQDIADVLGKQIDENNLIALAKEIVTNKNQAGINSVTEKVAKLTEDERATLQYFLAVYQSKNTQPNMYRQYISNLISASFSSSSQVMAFIVN